MFFWIMIIAGLLVVIASCHGEGGPRSGSKAPDFELRDLQGKTHRLSDYQGKMVHLHFWADWCPRCHEEFDNMGNAYKKLKKMYPDFEILAVNVDQPLVHVEEFIKKHETKFPVLLDVGSKVARTYGLIGIPCNFLIGRDGKIKDVLLGWVDEPYLEKSLKKIAAQ